MKVILRTLLLSLVLVMFTPTWTEALASGPGEGGRRVRLDDAEAGPYLVRAVTSPTPPTVENLYIEVRVTDQESGEVLTELEVTVHASQIDGDAPEITEVAVHDIAPIPTEYAAHLPVSATGLWEVQILIEGERGSGEVSFIERVQNPPNISWVVAVGAPVGGLIMLGAIFFWLQRNAGGKGEL